MKSNKHKKDMESDSSSSDSSDSSSSDSESSASSSADRGNRKRASKRSTKRVKEGSISSVENKTTKKKCKQNRNVSSDKEGLRKAKREAEQSKWNSPKEKRKVVRDSPPVHNKQYRDGSVDRKKSGNNSESKVRPSENRDNRGREDNKSRDNNYYKERQSRDDSRFKRHRNNSRYERRDHRNDDRDNNHDGRFHRNVDRRRNRSDSRDVEDKDHKHNMGEDRHSRYKKKRRSRSNSFDHNAAKWGKSDGNPKKDSLKADKEKPNFGLSGKLTEETNTYRGVVIKYSEPPEARKPKRRWRLYPFKGEKAMQTLYIHRESAYLIGRERKVVDLPVDHPSCSKQHAVLQYRLVPFTRDDGSAGKRVRPYLIDLESANGTFINNKKVDSKKYVELLEKDVIKFGFSSREYVLLHENSKDEGLDDDVKAEEEEKELIVKKEEPAV